MRKALSQINREVSYAQKKGIKSYFTKENLSTVYNRHKGKCSICGTSLTSLTARFFLYVPIRNGGKAEVENLMLSCLHCKTGYSPIPRAKARVEGYNSIPDLIVSLVEAVKEGKTSLDIKVIKTDLNAALSELVQSLNYLPERELREKLPMPIVSGENTIADLVEKAAKDEKVIEDIKETFDTISTTRKYIVLRNTSED